jgi:hypothetical protein
MVLAAGGHDNSGNVRLFKAQPKRSRQHHEDAAATIRINGIGNGYL